MAKIPEYKDNYALEYPRYTQPVDFEKPVMTAIIEGICDVIQAELEDNINTLIETNNIGSASGELLDFWGELVNETRKARIDDIYKIYIRAKIRRNNSTGTWADLVDIIRSLYFVSDMVVSIFDADYAEAILEAQYSYVEADVDPVSIFALIDKARAAGVKLNYIFWPDTEDNLFTFSSLENAVESDTARGLANDLQTQGGRLVGVLSS